MADVKISELPAATFVDSPDIVPIVQAGSTKKASVSLFQSFLKFIGFDFTGNSLTFMNGTTIWKSTGDSNDPVTHPYTPTTAGMIFKDANNAEFGRIWFDDPVNRQNTVIGALAGINLTDTGTTNTTIGFKALESAQTIGQGNVGIGSRVFPNRAATGSFNTLVGSLAKLSDENISNAVGIGENAAVGDTSIAIGGVAEAQGIGSITIGYLLTNNEDDSIAIGGYADVGNHTATIGSSTITDLYANPSGTAILHGKGDSIVFPDSDPHVVGAAYWVAGALVRSAG